MIGVERCVRRNFLLGTQDAAWENLSYLEFKRLHPPSLSWRHRVGLGQTDAILGV